MFADNVSLLIAFVAGVASFVSPCILPIIPSYLSFLGGISYGELTGQGASRRGVFLRTLFFVAGFSLVFMALGALFSSAGLALSGAQQTINRVAGAVVVFFGLNFIFDFWKVLNVERRFHLRKRPRGALGAGLLGLAFGAGWTPCVGPILASILFLAGASGKVAHGTLLLAVYSLGLGTPFLLAGAFFSWFARQMARIRPYLRAVRIGSGAFLVMLGALIFTGSLARLNVFLFRLAAGLEAWSRSDPAGPRLLFGGLFLALALLAAALYGLRVRRELAPGSRPPAPRAAARWAVLYPGRLALFLALLAASILAFANLLDVPGLLAAWLRFQGI